MKPTATLRPYQEEALEFLKVKGSAYLALEMGLGKTMITLSYIDWLLEQKLSKAVLIVAPLRVARLVWPQEAAAWANFRRLKLTLLHGPKKEAAFFSGSNVFVINYEGLAWLYKMVKQTKIMPFDVAVWDESSKLKSLTKTSRIKIITTLLPHLKRRVLLSGTPMPNSHADLFHQMLVVDKGERLGTKVTHFKNEHMDEGYQRFTWKMKPGHGKIIEDKIKDVFLHIPKENNVCTPGSTIEDVELSLPEEAKIIYKSMEKDLFAQLDDTTITAANAAVKSLKCLQIAAGAMYESDRAVQDIHNVKMDSLKSVIKAKKGNFLVFYHFKFDREKLKKQIPGVKFLGGVPIKEETQNVEDWNAGRVKVLAAQVASTSHGLNLQGCKASIYWLTLPWSLELYLQGNARVDRSGQKHHTMIYRNIMKGTIDEVVASVLDRRSKGQNALLNVLLEYRKGRK